MTCGTLPIDCLKGNVIDSIVFTCQFEVSRSRLGAGVSTQEWTPGLPVMGCRGRVDVVGVGILVPESSVYTFVSLYFVLSGNSQNKAILSV